MTLTDGGEVGGGRSIRRGVILSLCIRQRPSVDWTMMLGDHVGLPCLEIRSLFKFHEINPYVARFTILQSEIHLSNAQWEELP